MGLCASNALNGIHMPLASHAGELGPGTIMGSAAYNITIMPAGGPVHAACTCTDVPSPFRGCLLMTHAHTRSQMPFTSPSSYAARAPQCA